MRHTIAASAALVLTLLMVGSAWAQEGDTAFDSGGDGFEQQDQSSQGDKGDNRGDRSSRARGNSSSGSGVSSPTTGPSGAQGKVSDVTTKEYRDWTVRCGKVPKRGEQCEMSQQVSGEGSDQAVMRVVVGYPPQGDQPAAIFQLPLGIVLSKGIAIKVDDGEPMRFPVQICVKQGCRADLPLKSDLLQQMKAGRTARILVRTPKAKNGRAALPVSLLGFTAALNHLNEAR